MKDPPLARGVTVNHVYQDLYDLKYRFPSSNLPPVILPSVSDEYLEIIVAAAVGAFPQDRQFRDLRQLYVDLFRSDTREFDPNSLLEALFDFTEVPHSVASHDITVRYEPGRHPPRSFLILDPRKGSDLIDFWNLRALGWNVAPWVVPQTEGQAERCSRLITQWFERTGGPQEPFKAIHLLKGRSIARATFEDVCASLSVPKGAVVIQPWYPRLWKPYAREHEPGLRPVYFSKKALLEPRTEEGELAFPSLQPPYADQVPLTGQALWTNEIEMRVFGSDFDTPPVFPPGLTEMDKLLQTHDFDVTHQIRSGVAVLCCMDDNTIRWRIPNNEDLFKAWARRQGQELAISSAGKIAFHVLRNLGGPRGAWRIAEPKIVKELNSMTSEATGSVGKWLSILEAEGAEGAEGREGARRHLEHLLDSRVLGLGMEIQCPVCDQRNWYSLDAIGDELLCKHCLNEFPFPMSAPPKDPWRFRSLGPFSIENYGQGSFVVALSLRVLGHQIRGMQTWIPSFTLEGRGRSLEADFGCFWQSNSYRGNVPNLVLGECKSFNKFEQRDFGRMRRLAAAFPGACLVFGTFRPRLDRSERIKIAEIATKGRDWGELDRLRNPVVVLTATELFAKPTLRSAWKEKGGRWAQLATRPIGVMHPLDDLADKTQQLYLDLESVNDWRKAQYQQRRRRGQEGGTV